MLLESTIPDGRTGRVGSGRGLDDNNTNSAQLELGLGLSLAKTIEDMLSDKEETNINDEN